MVCIQCSHLRIETFFAKRDESCLGDRKIIAAADAGVVCPPGSNSVAIAGIDDRIRTAIAPALPNRSVEPTLAALLLDYWNLYPLHKFL